LKEFADAFIGIIRAFGCLLGYIYVRLVSWRNNLRSRASDPGLIKMSYTRLRRLCPEDFATGIDPLDWIDQVAGARAVRNFLVADQLVHGDSRAAVVMSVSPLLVAAYTQELDCIAMLSFPDEFVQEFGLHARSRLLTVNRYTFGGRLASDLEEGRLSYHRYSNFRPLIADFLSDDTERIRARKATIIEDEWARAWVMGERYLARFGRVARDGNPWLCMNEAVDSYKSNT
jgi:hypothetical protein